MIPEVIIGVGSVALGGLLIWSLAWRHSTERARERNGYQRQLADWRKRAAEAESAARGYAEELYRRDLAEAEGAGYTRGYRDGEQARIKRDGTERRDPRLENGGTVVQMRRRTGHANGT